MVFIKYCLCVWNTCVQTQPEVITLTQDNNPVFEYKVYLTNQPKKPKNDNLKKQLHK